MCVCVCLFCWAFFFKQNNLRRGFYSDAVCVVSCYLFDSTSSWFFDICCYVCLLGWRSAHMPTDALFSLFYFSRLAVFTAFNSSEIFMHVVNGLSIVYNYYAYSCNFFSFLHWHCNCCCCFHINSTKWNSVKVFTLWKLLSFLFHCVWLRVGRWRKIRRRRRRSRKKSVTNHKANRSKLVII